MKRIFLLFAVFISSLFFAQWRATAMQGVKIKEGANVEKFYTLDILALKKQLLNAPEVQDNAKPVIITLPTKSGKIEKFAVYSFPVVDENLAEKYQLGSYIGIGVDDKAKQLRFSLAPNDFQSMIVKNGEYEFIEPQNREKTVYGVHGKTKKKTSTENFLCSTNEPSASKFQIEKLLKTGKAINSNTSVFSKMSDRKYRTLRLAVSTTAEYTNYFGGVPQALAAINATLTRVNGIFERDFATHLILQNFPQLIFTDAATDPYSVADLGAKGNWSVELQNTLTNTIGNSAYDLGHLFGASGGGGNAGCVGCVCTDDTSADNDKNKGSAFTSPANGIPQGDAFDIDFVAHEMAHQLGATHTFSYVLEGAGTNVEPGSGSTIMGYAGITDANVQSHADDYFHTITIQQVLDNLASKNCDVETSITNQPPVIAPLQDYTIPKGTAFALMAQASDPENDALTYTWEQIDNAEKVIKKITGNESSGAIFRSLPPTNSPIRYFPKLDKVLQGSLTNTSDWESVSYVPRTLHFSVTVRDNRLDQQAQTNSAMQTITVGNDGPFKINTVEVYSNVLAPVIWDVANTHQPPYNVANVQVDYSSDNGKTWTVLSASTPNDGTESFSFPSALNNSQVIIRVSALNNVFYAVKKVLVTTAKACDGTAPATISIGSVTANTAEISWSFIQNATYAVRYKKSTDSNWTPLNSAQNFIILNQLSEGEKYDVQVAAVCGGVQGQFGNAVQFSTLSGVAYCPVSAINADNEYISNVTLANLNNGSQASNYTDYSGDVTKTINLTRGAQYTLSVAKSWLTTTYNEGVKAWIDYNRNGVFEDSELIMKTAPSTLSPVVSKFIVSTNAVTGKVLRMRVVLSYDALPVDACTNVEYGEVEDYAVVINDDLLATDAIKIYMDGFQENLYITKISGGAQYKIYDMSGRLIRGGAVPYNKVSLSGLVVGVYVLAIEDGKEKATFKFRKN